MKKFALLALIVVAPLVSAMFSRPPGLPPHQETPPAKQDSKPDKPEMPPPPGEHHKWLEQLVGTWTVETEMIPGEGEQPMKCTGTDTVRSLGGRWIVGELKSEIPDMGPMNAILTVGYNPKTGKYQGTWVDSVTDQLWFYVGTLDSTKKILTLEAEGPNMMAPSKGNTKYRDTIELKSPDHRTLTSSALVDGKWVQFMTAHYRKAK
ncbi:MAG: DUF1579 domain-containing protein [Phycisphaerales bacterium]|nr:DUF1579 domain-containing protein [Phycisphaerales bacterium]